MRQYLSALLKDWLQIVFFSLDILGLIIFYSPQTIIPDWLGIALFFISITIANARAYAELQNKLNAYEMQTPELEIEISDSYTLRAYIDQQPVMNFLKVGLLLNLVIHNNSIWPAKLENLFVKQPILPSKPSLYMRGSSELGIVNGYLPNKAEMTISPKVKSFSEGDLVASPRDTLRKTAQLSFTYMGSLTEPREWDLEQFDVNRLSKHTIAATLVYSYETNSKRQRAVLDFDFNISILPVVAVIAKWSSRYPNNASITWF